MIYHKIKFNTGLGDTEGYQVIDASGQQARLTDLNGVDLVLPGDYSFDFTQTNAPTPAWG